MNMTKLKNISGKHLLSQCKLVTKKANACNNLGIVFNAGLGECDKAKEYIEKGLAIRLQIGDKEGEASSDNNLGTVFRFLGEYDS